MSKARTEKSNNSSWAIVALVFIFVVMGISAFGMYSLLNSEEVKAATASAIVDIGWGVSVLLVALGAGVMLCAVGWAIGRGGPTVDRGITQRHLIDVLERKGGALRLPGGETWEIYDPALLNVASDKLLENSVS